MTSDFLERKSKTQGIKLATSHMETHPKGIRNEDASINKVLYKGLSQGPGDQDRVR